MKRYVYILLSGALFPLASCMMEDEMIVPTCPNINSGIQIIGAAEDFDVHNVATKANDSVSDSHITEMTLLIFDNNNDLIPAYNNSELTGDAISSHIHIDKPNPTFLIEATKNGSYGILASMEVGVATEKYYKNNVEGLDACKIYIIANAWNLLGSRLENYEIKTLAQLEAALVDTDATLQMPKDAEGNYIGFPMIGTAWDGTYTNNTDGTTVRNIQKFNLSYNGGTSTNDVATIPLKKLYSKVYFRIQVNSKQIVTNGQTPSFEIDRAEVYNVPGKIRMEYAEGDYTTNIGNEYLYKYIDPTNKTPFTINAFNKKTIYHSSSATTNDYIEFSVFLPEHKVTPKAIDYPTNITEDLKQYYKPLGIGAVSEGGITTEKTAPFVRIHGKYTDHNAQIRNVYYDIYLGQDNWSDFEIKRNQQLNNYISITGLTNHKDAYADVSGNISVDHRVSMNDSGYNLSMEREAILDAHFEVRPLDIELQPGGSMTVVIPDEHKSWIAMESDATALAANGTSNAGLYVSTTKVRGGVRKYFTTNLVSELTTNLASSGNAITVKHSGADDKKTEIHRIWFYIDENPNVYDKSGTGAQAGETGYTVGSDLYRLAKVKFYYAGDNATPDTTGEPSATVNFQQWNLWRVWNAAGNRYYDIEHEEEYLNNYASDQGYGETQDGMAWGLDGIQLSNKQQAAYVDNSGGIIKVIFDIFGSFESFINDVIAESDATPYYDFYLTRDNPFEGITPRDYHGLVFNKEIVTTLLTSYPNDSRVMLNGVILSQDVNSAIAYCYNKNKRDANGQVCTMNTDGSVNTDNLKWYLPSIDEIEDISKGAYDEFDRVFQSQEYWSCQPAFRKNTISIKYRGIFTTSTASGDYLDDDVVRARATKVEYNSTISDYDNISSSVTGNSYILEAQNNGAYSSDFTYNQTPANESISYHEGNNLRSDKCRIRAVYRSGEGTRTSQSQ